MSSLDIESMAKQAGRIVAGEKMDAPKPKAFMIVFNRPESLSPFLEQVPIEDALISTSMNSAIVGGFAPNKDLLNLIVSRVDAFKNAFNDLLLDQVSGDNWLEDYLSLKDFGIDYVSEVHKVSSPEVFRKHMAENLSHRGKMLKHRFDIHDQHEKSASMTFMDVVNDLSDFIVDNCEGYGSEEKVRKALFSLVKTLEAQAASTFFLDTHYSQDGQFALEEYCRHHRPEDLMINYDAKYDLINLNSKIAGDQRVLYDTVMPASKSLLKKTFPDLSMKGLEILLEDEDAEVGLTKGFKGLAISGIRSDGFEDRMHPQNLRYRIQEQGDSLHECLGNAIIAYAYDLMRYRHEHAHKQALIEFSKDIAGKDYFEHAMDLIEQSRPKLYQGEQLGMKGTENTPSLG